MSKIKSNFNLSFNQLFYCKIYINEIEVIPENILSLNIREWIINLVPRLELNLSDDGMLTEIFSLDDECEIRVEIGKNTTDDPIELNFILQDYNIDVISNNQTRVIEITGLLNSQLLYTPIYNRPFSNKSTKNIIENIANQCDLTFKSKTNFRTNDNMTWLQINQSNFDFINHLSDRSFINNDCVFTYCDINNNLNMTSLKTELNKNSIKAKYNIENYTKNTFDNTEDENTIWFNYYNVTNLSGYYNKINNYGVNYSYYDLTKFISKSIKQDNSLLSKKTLKNKNNIGNISNHYNYVLQNNVYENYSKAITQNNYYKMNMLSYCLSLNINPLYNIKLFDKLNVLIPAMPNYNAKDISDIMSGEYIVGGIVYSVAKGNIFQKQLVLFRDGINESTYVKKESNNK